MFILSSISRGLELWSTNHTSTYENAKSKVFKNIKFLGQISNNWPNDLLETNVCKTLEFCSYLLLITLQCINITSVISKGGTFLPFLCFVILILVYPNNFIVSAVKSSI